MTQALTCAETKMAEILWNTVPMQTSDLIAECAEKFAWKRTTTYTILKHLEEKQVFYNDGGTIQARLTRKQYETEQTRAFVSDTFGGSLPKFLAAFTGGRPLDKKDTEQLQHLIDSYQEE